MANELEDFAGVAPASIEDFVGTQEVLKKSTVPEKTLKTRAAYAALLSSSPDALFPNYQAVLAESKEGSNFKYKQMLDESQKYSSPQDIKVMSSVLADPRFNDAQKQAMLDAYKNGELKEPINVAATQAAVAPIKGENNEAEEVRISGAEQFKGIREYREFVQNMRNKKEIDIAKGGFNSYFSSLLETAIIPFATNKVAAGQIASMAKAIGSEQNRGTAFALPGSAIASLRDALHSMPADKRLAAGKMLVSMIEENNSVFIGENKVNALNQINAVLGGDYSTFDKYVDNLVTVLDVVGVGSVAKSAITKVLKKGAKTQTPREAYLEGEYLGKEVANSEEAKLNLRGISDRSSPVSPARLIGEQNNEKGRAMYKLAADAGTDEAAEALYGTSKAEAIHSQAIPQPSVADGTIDTRVPNIAEELDVAEDIINEPKEYGATWFSDREKNAAKAYVENDLQTISGIKMFDNMSTVVAAGDKVSVAATFGQKSGGFLNAEEALNQTAFSLREYGVLPSDLKILKREAGEYVPVDLADVKGVNGDYVVQWDSKIDYRSDMIGELDKTKARLNFFDSFTTLRSKKAGTLARTLMDASSMLDKLYGGAAAVQADKAVRLDKLLLEQHKKFSDVFVGLPKSRQEKLYEHIKEANQKGLELSDNDLIARGFAQPEIQALKEWRKSWNTHWYLENQDMAKTLRTQGYQVMDNGSDKFFAKPVAKNKNLDEVYDPVTQSVIRLDPLKMDNLYNGGGTVAELRRPVVINGKEVSHLMVRNTPTEYLRALRDSDQILNYRKGYYHVSYKAPKYVVEKVRDSKGNVKYERAVELAGGIEEAEHVRRRLATSSGRSIDDFDVRGDKQLGKPDTDYYWDLQSVSGRVAQRHRGKTLADANAPVGAFDSKWIADPVESAIRASRSISTRVALRDMIEAMKQRTIQQWEQYFPKNEWGKAEWVDDSNSLVAPGKMTEKGIRDARTAVEYVNYLQHGYENAIDETFKMVTNHYADLLGSAKLGKAEKALRSISDLAPADTIKGAVYHAFIGTHFTRQFLLQAHQSVRIMAINPEYAFSTRSLTEYYTVYNYLLGMTDINKVSKESRELIEFVEKSGALDAIDRSNLVRGSLTDMAESSNKATRVVGKAFAFPRKLGFDTGETINMVTHLLASRDLALKKGKKLNNKAVRDEVYSFSRALTYDMNVAGDMPYNQNWASMAMQFFQVPHKAWLQYTNRRIPTDVKLRLAVLDAFLWGGAGTVAYKYIPEDYLPENPEVKEALIFGAESWIYNSAISKMMGEETNIDFSSFSPYGTDGFMRLAQAVSSMDFGPMIAKMPATSVGSRIGEASQRMARYFGFIDQDVGLEKEEAIDLVHGFAGIFSAYDHGRKAYLIHKMGEIRDKSTGKRLVEDANWAYAAAQVAGFKSQEEVLGWAFMEEASKSKKDYSKEVEKDYKTYLKILVRDQKLSNEDPEFAIKILGIMRMKWEDDPEAMRLVNGWLKRDVVRYQDQIGNIILPYAKIPNSTDTDRALDNLEVLKDKKIDRAREFVNDYRESIKNHKEEK